MIKDLKEMVGKVLLVGLSYENEHGVITEQTEYCGTVIGVENDCVVVKPSDVDQCAVLPLILDAYEKARPGVYSLRANGKTVKDPDYTCMFIVTDEKEEQ